MAPAWYCPPRAAAGAVGAPVSYCLAGYSFGGAVALEMAQQLWARGARVACLAIIDGGLIVREGTPARPTARPSSRTSCVAGELEPGEHCYLGLDLDALCRFSEALAERPAVAPVPPGEAWPPPAIVFDLFLWPGQENGN